MKKLFAVLLVCMLALTGAALAETEESEATPYVSGLGYTIGLPEGWMVLDQAAYDASVDEGLAGVLAEAGITAETLPTLLEEGVECFISEDSSTGFALVRKLELVTDVEAEHARLRDAFEAAGSNDFASGEIPIDANSYRIYEGTLPGSWKTVLAIDTDDATYQLEFTGVEAAVLIDMVGSATFG